MPLQMMQIADFGATDTVQRGGGYYLNGGAAFDQIYAIADERHVVLGAVEPKFRANFCSEAGRPDLIARHGDAMPQTALRAEVAAILAPMTAEEVKRRFGPLDCCLSVVSDPGQALAGAQVTERQLVRTDAGGEAQSLLPIWIDGARPPLRRPLREEHGLQPAAATQGVSSG